MAAPHPFAVDPELPHADHQGRRVCRCGVADNPREPRLPRHQMPDVPEQAEHRGRYEAEGGD